MSHVVSGLPFPYVPTFLAPDAPALARLAELLRVYAPHDGSFELRFPGLTANREARTDRTLTHSVQRPALCIVAQGAKSVRLGSEVYHYDTARMLVYSVDLPVASQVTQASADQPYLCFKLELDPRRIAELTLKVYPQGAPLVPEGRGLAVGQANTGIVNAATRLLELLSDERDTELIAPVVADEILVRLLRSPIGGRVAHLGQAASRVQRVAKAVEWLRRHVDQPVDVPGLANLVHMGVSTFHAHFKAVTSMSPVQYQKLLRLQEARRLLALSPVDAATVGRQVGYHSASQFSREYARLFGSAPSRDLASLRKQGEPRN